MTARPGSGPCVGPCIWEWNFCVAMNRLPRRTKSASRPIKQEGGWGNAPEYVHQKSLQTPARCSRARNLSRRQESMKIAKIRIDGFGVWRDLEIDALAGQA